MVKVNTLYKFHNLAWLLLCPLLSLKAASSNVGIINIKMPSMNLLTKLLAATIIDFSSFEIAAFPNSIEPKTIIITGTNILIM